MDMTKPSGSDNKRKRTNDDSCELTELEATVDSISKLCHVASDRLKKALTKDEFYQVLKIKGYTIGRFSYIDFRGDCFAEQYKQKNENEWAVGFYRHWYALMKLSGRDVEGLLSIDKIKDGVSMIYKTKDNGLRDTDGLIDFMSKHVKKIRYHCKEEGGQEDDFEQLIERLLIQRGPLVADVYYHPSYAKVEFRGVLCPTPMEKDIALYGNPNFEKTHMLLLSGYGTDVHSRIPNPYWQLYDSRGSKFGECGFIRLERKHGLILRVLEMVLNDDNRAEVPEVEAAKIAIQENCVGRKINAVNHKCSLDMNLIVGKTIMAARRKGTHIWLELDSHLCVHFKIYMHFAIFIKGINKTKYPRCVVKKWPPKKSHLMIKLDGNIDVSFFSEGDKAKYELSEKPESVHPLSQLGPDALLEPMEIDKFVKSLKSMKVFIKLLLVDQSFISGIGNWIADEALYQERIHPLEIASCLSEEQCKGLHRSIKQVIETAVRAPTKGHYPKSWIYHSRKEKPGKSFVDNKEVDFISARGWTTAYVPEVQILSLKEVDEVDEM